LAIRLLLFPDDFVEVRDFFEAGFVGRLAIDPPSPDAHAAAMPDAGVL
jgi:hypothetical protein